MTIRVAINGYGRIGQAVLRAWMERCIQHPNAADSLEIVAINELADTESVAYLTRYDSAHGRFPVAVKLNQSDLMLGNEQDNPWGQQKSVHLLRKKNPSECPWAELDIDVVLECTGQIKTRQQAQAHLLAGAKKVLISNPADNLVDATVLFGFNQDCLTGDEEVIANGSCSTNALIPVLDTLHKEFGIEQGVTTTIHSAMNDQPVIDAYHSDLRRTRAAHHSIIPVDTGLAKGVDRMLPELAGKIESLHVRVPTLNVSVLDVSLSLATEVSVATINGCLDRMVKQYSEVIGITHEPHASVDFNHDARSAIVDGTQTRVSNKRLLKLFIWFDNEWGFANRMIDTSLILFNKH